MLVRMLGLEGKKAGVALPAGLNGRFPDWARNSLALALALALAVENGIVTPEETAGWQANEPASRWKISFQYNVILDSFQEIFYN
ncbi:MAG TPA: hypothetical protein GXX25_07160 [Desulfotomaculum sp.]|nr:hypothetical protein [Desulfotomaculum sp.]